jgi:hypothetical protein
MATYLYITLRILKRVPTRDQTQRIDNLGQSHLQSLQAHKITLQFLPLKYVKVLEFRLNRCQLEGKP